MRASSRVAPNSQSMAILRKSTINATSLASQTLYRLSLARPGGYESVKGLARETKMPQCFRLDVAFTDGSDNVELSVMVSDQSGL